MRLASHSYALAALAAALVGCMAAGPAGAEPDPLALVEASAATVAGAPSATVDFAAESRIVMGEETVENGMRFVFRRGPANAGEGFAFLPVVNGQVAPPMGDLAVRGAGGVLLTRLPPRGQYTVDEVEQPLTTFVESPFAAGIGNGLGGLALSFLDPAAAEGLVARVTAAEYVGEETADDETLLRCRYTVEDELTFDAWFTAGERPVVRRIAPDLTAMTAGSPLAQQHDNFAYTIDFTFDGWNLDARLGAADFLLLEPAGAELVTAFGGRGEVGPSPLLGEPAPRFTLENLRGEEIDLAAHLGTDVVLLDFWATWCPPCVAALPKIDRVAAAYAERGVAFYAVNQDEAAEQVTEFLESRGLEAPVLLDAGSVAARTYGVESLPTSVLIGRDGTVQVMHIGFGGDLEQRLASELESLLAGDDLAAATLAEAAEAEAVKQAELARLRALLDTP